MRRQRVGGQYQGVTLAQQGWNDGGEDMLLGVGERSPCPETVQQFAGNNQIAQFALVVVRRGYHFHRAVFCLCGHSSISRRIQNSHSVSDTVVHILGRTHINICTRSYVVGIAAGTHLLGGGVLVLAAPVESAVETQRNGNRCGCTGLYLCAGERPYTRRGGYSTYYAGVVGTE